MDKFNRGQMRHNIVESDPMPRPTTSSSKSFSLEVWIVISLSGTLIFGAVIVWVLWVLRTYPIVKIIFVTCTALLPIFAIVMCVLKLIEQWQKTIRHETVDVGEHGTVFRDWRGKLQIVAPNEMFALETKDAHRTPVGQSQQPASSDDYARFVKMLEMSLNRPISEVALDGRTNIPTWDELKKDSSFPDPFPESFPPMNGQNGGLEMEMEMEMEMETETETETSLDDAAWLIMREEEAAKQRIKQEQENILKERILFWLNKGLNHSTVASRLRLGGRKYIPDYQRLCNEMGIDTNKPYAADMSATSGNDIKNT